MGSLVLYPYVVFCKSFALGVHINRNEKDCFQDQAVTKNHHKICLQVPLSLTKDRIKILVEEYIPVSRLP